MLIVPEPFFLGMPAVCQSNVFLQSDFMRKEIRFTHIYPAVTTQQYTRMHSA